jgi:hypothetical protein
MLWGMMNACAAAAATQCYATVEVFDSMRAAARHTAPGRVPDRTCCPGQLCSGASNSCSVVAPQERLRHSAAGSSWQISVCVLERNSYARQVLTNAPVHERKGRRLAELTAQS